MTAFFVCLNAVVPIFLIMALGCLARHLGAIKREDVPKLNRLLFRYFMPVMLFYNIYTSDLSGAVQPKLLIFAAGGVLLEYALAFAYVMLTEKDTAKRGVKIQGIYRSNFVIIGLPLATALVPGADAGPVVVLISVVVPMFNAIAVITLELFSGKRPNALGIIIDVFKNPLILGTVVGIAFQLLGIHLPKALLSTIKQISAATSRTSLAAYAHTRRKIAPTRRRKNKYFQEKNRKKRRHPLRTASVSCYNKRCSEINREVLFYVWSF